VREIGVVSVMFMYGGRAVGAGDGRMRLRLGVDVGVGVLVHVSGW
jgi:hypothetical protein